MRKERMTLLASKCVDGAAQRALSLAKCVNKVAQWGFKVSACWLWLISPQCTTRTEAAEGRRVTNQIWRNLMLA